VEQAHYADKPNPWYCDIKFIKTGILTIIIFISFAAFYRLFSMAAWLVQCGVRSCCLFTYLGIQR
jgi:hypothetical protein